MVYPTSPPNHIKYLESFCVFLLAASVRFTNLNQFRVVDEEDRWAWGRDFFRAILAGDLPATLVGDGYPGIFPAWLETVWLLAASLYRSLLQGSWIGDEGIYLLLHEWSRWSHLSLQRFPVVLVNTLLVVGIFLYTRKLFGRQVALLAAVLISLDPFYLSDSRVNRAEALLTGLMALSLLALIYSLRETDRRHLIISAVFGGLAWLTKSQSLVLLPMFGVITLLWHWQTVNWRLDLHQAVVTMLGWAGLAALTFLLLWPATWTIPGPTFTLMTQYIIRKVGEEGVKLFFLGQTILDEDPGLLFYPIIFLLRVTPLTLVGLTIGLGLIISRQGRAQWAWFDQAGAWALLIYTLLYVGGMSLGSHKQGRFLMAVFPALNILAALAYLALAQRLSWSTRRIWIAGAVLLSLQLATVLPFHPYYFSYFNPLMGGGPTATQLTRIGWGEGMDQVATYLNSLDQPETLEVSTRFYKYLLGFKGTPTNLGASGEWVRADKIVFYVQQVQRMLDPSPGIIRYFQQHVPPEKVITIDRIDYAWIYPNSIAYPADPRTDHIEGRLRLLGYRWKTMPQGGQVTLIWENLGHQSGSIALRLQTIEANRNPWQPCETAPGFEQAVQTSGEVVESNCLLVTDDLSAGLYSLQLGLREDDAPWQPMDFAAGWAAISIAADKTMSRVSPAVAFAELAEKALPTEATRLPRAYAGQVRLLGYILSSPTLQPGQTLSLDLYWQAMRPLRQDVEVTVQAFLGEKRIALLNGIPVNGTRPTTSWQPGEVIRDSWSIPLPNDLPTPALIRLDVGLFQPEILRPLQAQNLVGEDVPGAITSLRLLPEAWPHYPGDQPTDYTFNTAIRLLGYSQIDHQDRNMLDITLYWQSLASLATDYTVFVHLIKPDGTLAAQSDVPPARGYYPISAWQPNEVILSYHQLILPSDLPEGTYTLIAGLYQPTDWTRLPVVDADGITSPNQAAVLGTLKIP